MEVDGFASSPLPKKVLQNDRVLVCPNQYVALVRYGRLYGDISEGSAIPLPLASCLRAVVLFFVG